MPLDEPFVPQKPVNEIVAKKSFLGTHMYIATSTSGKV